MCCLSYSIAIRLVLTVTMVSCFSSEMSLLDSNSYKLAANDGLLVQSLASESSFLLRLAPYTSSLTCTIAYNGSGQYIFAVALARQVTAVNSTLRFVFVGVDTPNDVPFIGSLTYAGISGDAYVASVNSTGKMPFPCDGWNPTNYKIHRLNSRINMDFFTVAVE